MRDFISYNKSLEIINSIVFDKIPTQKLFITNVIGRVLAKDIVADHNSPEFPTSGMDGYAIKFEDISNDFIEIVDKNPAGFVVEKSVENGSCIKTFTGSLMPKGSDTLVPIENVEVTNVTLDQKELSINVGQSKTLVKKLAPLYADEQLTWSSRDEDIASVDQNGIVTAKKVGSTMMKFMLRV